MKQSVVWCAHGGKSISNFSACALVINDYAWRVSACYLLVKTVCFLSVEARDYVCNYSTFRCLVPSARTMKTAASNTRLALYYGSVT
jgi:hypothetical protein